MLIEEKVGGKHLLLLGLAGCRVSDSKGLLRALRSAFPRLEIQLMRADRIGGKEHVLFAARNAVRAFSQRRGRSHNLAVELLLYASCQRQISKAIEILGLKPGTSGVVLAALSNRTIPLRIVERATRELSATLDDNVLEISSRRKAASLARVYGISALEMEASRLSGEGENSVLKRLIIERSALLSVQN